MEVFFLILLNVVLPVFLLIAAGVVWKSSRMCSTGCFNVNYT